MKKGSNQKAKSDYDVKDTNQNDLSINKENSLVNSLVTSFAFYAPYG